MIFEAGPLHIQRSRNAQPAKNFFLLHFLHCIAAKIHLLPHILWNILTYTKQLTKTTAANNNFKLKLSKFDYHLSCIFNSNAILIFFGALFSAYGEFCFCPPAMMVRFAMVQPLRIGDFALVQNEMNMPFAHLWPTARPVAGPGPWSSKALEMQRLSSSKQLRQDIYKKKTDQTSMMRKNRITSCDALAVTRRPTSEAKWKYSNVLQQTAWPFYWHWFEHSTVEES